MVASSTAALALSRDPGFFTGINLQHNLGVYFSVFRVSIVGLRLDTYPRAR